MKIFKTSQIKELDAYTIAHEPITSFCLMQRASSELCDALLYMLKRDCRVCIIAGSGNNGGDALVIANYLSLVGCYNLSVYLVSSSKKFSDDCKQARAELEKRPVKIIEIDDSNLNTLVIGENDYVLDGLFGSGLNRKLEGFYKEVVKRINASGATVISIDIPSGLFGEDNRQNDAEAIVCADYTFSFQFPKVAFFLPENEKYLGQVRWLDIRLHPQGMKEIPSDYYYLDKSLLKPMLHHRTKFSHKGTYGHALLIAGSYGMVGAAVLASKSCLRTGCGLLSVHLPSRCCDVLQIAVPEAMLNLDANDNCFSGIDDLARFNAIGIGPALGKKDETKAALVSLLKRASVPLVLDADALNIIAEEDCLALLPENTIITPHPKEFDRLAGASFSGYDRLEKQMDLSSKYKIIIVLKGAHTSISLPDGRCFFNSTGNPGMATAGSGDTLTGIILSLLAQKYEPEKAALLGVYLHGLAGDLAAEASSEESLIASDISAYLGMAFAKLREE
ncbi:MAG TPA: NAD(P)H-hydrate dehydratase [Paludibacteraceae bacterium]|nr:NAD(P)H-hydrate dehydratase [Paludibacteraceae bacterium]HOU68659.1 NAD(P)H-hydrate dehydratase [Paludibacteraceae bacterium]HPH62216.1 NAD(P)H-hydrate dehydratase [Paludibacteraceae bacterium]HQF50453.1 NAD(P)H-hydrate dehydratase [Paludibacteraceae bacterium]